MIKYVGLACVFWIMSPTLQPWKASLSAKLNHSKPKDRQLWKHGDLEKLPLSKGEAILLCVHFNLLFAGGFVADRARDAAAFASLVCFGCFLETPALFTVQRETEKQIVHCVLYKIFFDAFCTHIFLH